MTYSTTITPGWPGVDEGSTVTALVETGEFEGPERLLVRRLFNDQGWVTETDRLVRDDQILSIGVDK